MIDLEGTFEYTIITVKNKYHKNRVKLGKTKQAHVYKTSHFSFSDKCLLIKNQISDQIVRGRIYLSKITDISVAIQNQIYIVRFIFNE